MSKRPGSTTEANPSKRARKPAGFRAARSISTLQTNTSNSSLFVTVTQPNERRGILKARTRIFHNSPEPPASSSTPDTHSNAPKPAVDTQYDDISDPLPESPSVVEVPDPNPKRKRHTKNAVSILF
jgi:hypothetical protein